MIAGTTNLPEGWVWTAAEEVCRQIPSGATPPANEMTRDHGEIPFVKVYNLTFDGSLDFSLNPTFIPRSTHERRMARSRAHPGDVLMNIVGPPLGKVSILPNTYPEWNFNQAIVAFQVNERIDGRFLSFYLRSHYLLDWTRTSSKATAGQHNLAVTACRKMPIPVPPIDQQRRIVEKIEALTQKSRRAKDALDAIPPLLERFRQSVLASAFRGDLTKDWRAQHPDVEPADKLLSRIRQERRHRWEQAELAKLNAKGKPPTDDRWKQKYEEPAPVDTEGLPDLPAGWCWASLETLTDPVRLIRYGMLMPGDDVPNGIPYVKVKHMRGDSIVPLAQLPRTTKAMSDKFAGALLAAGDLLLSIRGTYGRVAIVEDELQGANITQDSARVAPMPGVERSYLAAILRSPESQRYFDKIAKGVAVRGINIGDIRPMPIPLAPRKEQAVVALAAQRACGAVDAIASEVSRANGRNTVLDASILAKAFRGELTSNLSND